MKPMEIYRLRSLAAIVKRRRIMYKNFTRYLAFSLVLVFVVSGCSKPVSNNEVGQANIIAEAEKAGQVENKEPQSKEGVDNSKKIDVEAEKPKELKKTGKVIVIDPGHGGKSGSEKEKVSPDSNELKPKNVSGAAGIITKTPEPVVTLQVSQKLKEILEKEGYTVIMTRTSASQTIGNIERAEVGNKNNADLVIRVHADSSANSNIKGASMLVPGQVGYAKSIAQVSRKYGEAILKTLIDEVKMEDRGVVTRSDLTGFNWSKVPVVLIEMGFLSNPKEDNLLNSDDYQSKIASGLAKGIDKVFGDR